MAKAKNKESNVAKANDQVNETVTPADAATDVETIETVEKTEGVSMTLWRVEVECPTPLAHNPAEVLAFDEDQAWQVFLAKNGISGTKHKRTITAIENSQ